MTIKRVILGLSCVLTASGGLVGARVQQRPGWPTAVVHVKAFIPASGEEMRSVKVTLFKSPDGKDYSGQFRDNRAVRIPYGSYWLQANSEGFWPTAREVIIAQPEVWVVLAFEIGMGWQEGGEPRTLWGKIQNLPPKTSEIWVRATGIYSSFIGDAKVDEAGNFEMAVPGGDR